MSELYRSTPPAVPALEPKVVRVDTATGEIIENGPGAGGSKDQPEPGVRLIGRFDDLYLLFQVNRELLVVDQHTAHERVLFEEMMQRMDASGGTGQQLLLPVQVDLGTEQMVLFEEARELLVHAGFAVEHFGGTTVRIEAVPAVLSRKSPETALRAILDDTASLRKTGHDLKKAVAQSIACRSAVMAGDRLTEREAIGLVERLLKCDNRYSCPHGRPTFIKMSRDELDRQFGRG